MRKQKPYSRIPTPALPGSGSRDRTAIRLISAGLRQHPLDCEDILSRLSFFVKGKTHRNGREVGYYTKSYNIHIPPLDSCGSVWYDRQ